MKYIPLKLLFFLFVTNTLVAQIVNKGDIKISWGTNVYISGLDIINDNSGHLWSNNGTVIFKGDNFTNDGDMDANATGTTEFSGANEQYINGSNTAYFHNLVVNNTNNSVIQQTFVDADNLRVNDGAKDFDYKVVNDKSLTVNDVVTSNGDIRMIGTAQLIQTHPGASSNSGSKYLWIDQSGTTNQYWYNYWSAPVNQSGLWKIIYLRDGAEGDDNNISKYPLIQTIVSSAPSNDLPTQISHPVTLNAYWIFGFKNGLDGDYQTWFDNHLQDTGTVTPGEGYTMKGPGVDANLNNGNGNNTTTYKNWTFAGTPNDGDYSLSITAGNDYLVGNPYPSSLDADQFIKDNINSANGGNNSIDVFNGTLYFWEHTDGNDHYKDHYDGGYASYNLTGGTPATSWKSGNTVGAKTPDRYIPVGQGFFVWSETTNDGGNITFNNAQRIFKTTPNTLIRPVSLTNIRIGLDTPLNYHRQLLLGVRAGTTFDIDVGWDGPNFDSDYAGADMNWLINGKAFNIQAIPEINKDTRIPLKVSLNMDGMMTFTLDNVENLPAGIDALYIYDAANDSYHQIDYNKSFDLYLHVGDYNDRFALTFNNKTTLSEDELQLDGILAYYNPVLSEIDINTNQTISDVSLYALTGQEVLHHDIKSNTKFISIPVKLSKGVYLLKIMSHHNKTYTKKLFIK